MKTCQVLHYHNEIDNLTRCTSASLSLVRQLRLFLGVNNFLRYGARTHNAPLDHLSKFLALIPPTHPTTNLIISDTHAWPLYVGGGQGHIKGYICLLSCAVLRAVQLKAVPDLAECSFLETFRRFAGRKSLSVLMISDNASTYKASKLRQVSSDICDEITSNPFTSALRKNSQLSATRIWYHEWWSNRP